MELLLILWFLVLLVFAPFLLIWAVNTLFALSIAYTFKMWFAALLVILIIGR